MSGFVLVVGAMATAGNRAIAQEPAASCAPAIGRIVSLQGNVEVRRAGSATWMPVRRLDTAICAGDRLRTDALSRSLLFVQPESFVRVDQNTTITINQTTGEIEVQFFASELADALRSTRSRGAGYFITRFPKKFKVSTPHMNAAIEGTEFMVELSSEATKLTVLEGKVSSESVATRDAQLVTAGQSLQSRASGPAAIAAVVNPEDAVQWVLRYPPISDGSNASRAEELLRAGSVDEALAAIDSILSGDPTNSDAHALRAIIQVAKNDKSGALESAGRATTADSADFRAWLALSYARQADFDLDAALESALKAQSLQPASALAHARVAELQLSLGDFRRAEEAARAAIASSPAESHAHSMLGFVHLAQIDTKAARAAFEAAIERDSFSAMPRLGLGLAMIREGRLVAGREQLEVAVALDPSNSLLRSYVGKAYYEENSSKRDHLAATQFDMAADLDPNDPTPHFYEAILDQSQNRPVDALESLEAAVARNDNRAVYRSRLLIDDDAASRGATVAAIVGALGFERLDILESSQALAENPGNASAHRALASAYSNIPRHDIARVSEALQAQILQPVSIAPVPPLLGTDSLLVLKDVGPSEIGAQEFNQLYNRNGFELTAEAVAGSRDSLGGQVVMNGLADRVAYSLSAVNYDTDGFIENDSAEKSNYEAFVHGQLRPGSTVQAGFKHSSIEVGQTFVAFEPQFAEPDIITEQSDSFRLSGHQNTRTGSDWIWTGVYEDRTRKILSFPDEFLLIGNDSETSVVEVQNLARLGAWQVLSGIGYVDGETTYFDQVDESATAGNLYAYGQWQSPDRRIGVLAGFGFDWFELQSSAFAERIDKQRFNPKVGVVWSPLPGTTIRAAAISALKRPFVRGQTIEPTQVAGFNQYFTGFERFFGESDGSESRRLGVALDQTLSSSLFGGLELTRRDLDFALLSGDVAWEEKTALAYLYKTFATGSWQGSIALDGEYEKAERPSAFTGPEAILELETFRAPLALNLFNARGLTIRAAVTFVRQRGRFQAFVADPVVSKDDEAVITDFSLEYRLPRRMGGIAIGVNNAFDEFVDLVEIDPLNPRVATRQVAYARIVVNF